MEALKGESSYIKEIMSELIPMNIIQITYYFYENQKTVSQIIVISISFSMSLIDCWLGLNAWFDFNLINI